MSRFSHSHYATRTSNCSPFAPSRSLPHCAETIRAPPQNHSPSKTSAENRSSCCATATVSAISVLTPAHAPASHPTSRLKADSSAASWEWSRPVSASRSSLQWLSTATSPAATYASVILKLRERSSPLSCADAVLTAFSKPSHPVSEPQPHELKE